MAAFDDGAAILSFPTGARVQRSLGLVSHPLSEVLASAPERPDYYVEEMLARGAITSIGGFMGAGKSPFGLRLVKALKEQTDFLGYKVTAPPNLRVAYLTQDTSGVFGPVTRGVGFTDSDGIDIFYWDENLGIPWEQMVAAVAESPGDGGVMVIDVVSDWSSVDDENSAAEMTRAYGPLVAAAGRGMAVLALVHTVKTFDEQQDEDVDLRHIRGSGAIIGNSAIVLLYKKPKGAKLRNDTRLLKFARSKFGMPSRASLYVRMTEDGLLVPANDLDVAIKQVESADERVLKAVQSILAEGRLASGSSFAVEQRSRKENATARSRACQAGLARFACSVREREGTPTTTSWPKTSRPAEKFDSRVSLL